MMLLKSEEQVYIGQEDCKNYQEWKNKSHRNVEEKDLSKVEELEDYSEGYDTSDLEDEIVQKKTKLTSQKQESMRIYVNIKPEK